MLPEFISLGAGVQSSTMLFMTDRGLIKPMPRAAIFADTQQEPEIVYRWIKFMKEHVYHIPIIVATAGDLGEDALHIHTSKLGNKYLNLRVPLFIRNNSGGSGILSRHCTRDYKITVVANEIKRQLNLKRVTKQLGIIAKCWIGISDDEEERKRPSQIRWLENKWPLLQLGMTRDDCLSWMKDNHYPTPPRSACKFCPYHSDKTWLDLKINHPQDFQEAVLWEQKVQELIPQQNNLKGMTYLHASLVPLDRVIFDPTKKKDKFNRTCEGMCGV
jgi:hypothetical protein